MSLRLADAYVDILRGAAADTRKRHELRAARCCFRRFDAAALLLQRMPDVFACRRHCRGAMPCDAATITMLCYACEVCCGLRCCCHVFAAFAARRRFLMLRCCF